MYEVIAVGYPVRFVIADDRKSMHFIFELDGKQISASINDAAVWSVIGDDGKIPSEEYLADLEHLEKDMNLVVCAGSMSELFPKISRYHGVRQGMGCLQENGEPAIGLNKENIPVDEIKMTIWQEFRHGYTLLETYQAVCKTHNIDYAEFCSALKFLISKGLLFIV